MSIKLNIVEKADSLFRTYGIRGVTVDDICNACGISKKTIYKHYSDKYALANKSLEYHYDKLFKEINSIVKNSSNAIETFFKISMHFRETLNDQERKNKAVNDAINQGMQNYYKEVFDWLEKCENVFGFDLQGYGKARIYGFLAERFLSYWFQKNAKCETMNITFYDIRNDID